MMETPFPCRGSDPAIRFGFGYRCEIFLNEVAMRYRFSAVLPAVIALIVLAVVVHAAPPTAKKEMHEFELYPADKVKWQDGPPSLPKGAMIAVLEGDPNKEGPFVFRVKLPDGYTIPPHTHPKTERVTVIAGTFNIGMGDKFDEKASKAMPAGTYGHWPPGMKHFVWVKGETILQFHGMGPWSIQYLNPKDDPRNPK
jgi:quercetin dioxygenase-like cupin family protein